jgi:hypothetical protein
MFQGIIVKPDHVLECQVQLIVKDLEGNDCGLIEALIQYMPGKL